MENVNPQDALAEIDRMKDEIVRRFDPLKIILFGSYARGGFTTDSDVDLIVVMEVAGSKRQKATEIDVALCNRRLGLDVIVVTPQEFEKYRNVAGHVIYPAVREGRILYERAA